MVPDRAIGKLTTADQ